MRARSYRLIESNKLFDNEKNAVISIYKITAATLGKVKILVQSASMIEDHGI